MTQVEGSLYTGDIDSRHRAVSSIAMTVILVSFSMLFATLFLGYAAYRFTSDAWPPMGIERPALFLPTISTLFIIASSILYWRFESLFLGGFAKAKIWLWGVMALGLAFVASQFALWADLKSHGLLLSSGGVFSSIVYAFTWIHVAHMAAGILLLVWLLFTLREIEGPKAFAIRVQNVGKFWHFLGIVWLFMFFTIFVF